MTESRRDYVVSAAARTAGKKPKGPAAPRPPSQLEELFLLHCRAEGIPAAKREWRFHATRMWRFDFAWPDLRVAVECEGGTFSNGRHTRGSAYREDCQKYNAAQLGGWLVLRYDMALIKSGDAVRQVKDALAIRGLGL